MRQFILFILFLSIASIALADSTSYRIGVVESPPFTFLNEQDEWDGINVWLWDRIAKNENLTYEFVLIQNDSFQNLNIDAIIHPLIANFKNLDQLNFTPAYYTTNSTVLIDNVAGFQAIWNFVKSFLSLNFLKLVLAIFSLLLIMGLIVWRLERKKNPEQFKGGLKGIGNGIWWSAVTLSTVGYGDIAPKSLGGRIIGTIWMFAGILVVSAFTASMASLLTVSQISAAETTIIDYKQKNVGVINQSVSKAYLESNFFRHIIPVEDIDSGIEALKKKTIQAFVGDEAYLRYYLENENIKDYRILPYRFNPQFYAFGVTKENDPLYLQISKQLIDIVSGVEWQMLLEEYDISYH